MYSVCSSSIRLCMSCIHLHADLTGENAVVIQSSQSVQVAYWSAWLPSSHSLSLARTRIASFVHVSRFWHAEILRKRSGSRRVVSYKRVVPQLAIHAATSCTEHTWSVAHNATLVWIDRCEDARRWKSGGESVKAVRACPSCASRDAIVIALVTARNTSDFCHGIAWCWDTF